MTCKMGMCTLEGHCDCWADGLDCCSCGECSDDYFDLDEDDDLLPLADDVSDYVWDDGLDDDLEIDDD